MTTDRELLERSARAAGIVGSWEKDKAFIQDRYYFNVPYDNQNMLSGFRWNPLTDDGDALRLAVRLDLNVFQTAGSAYAVPSDDSGEFEEQVRYIDAGNDACAATRRAIVRCAAAMAPEKAR